jgi:RimJ/RimL family protein N-acetyltransferase
VKRISLDSVSAVLESDVVLKDGSSVHLRPIRPEDEHSLVEIFNHSSPQTVYQRFFTALPELTPDMAHHLSNTNTVNRLALVAEADAEPIGVARYEPTDEPDLVELAIVVVDKWQNRGLGRILVREILCAAERNGIRRFRADVLAENRRMLRLLATEGRILERKTEAGVTSILLSLRGTGTS